MTKIILCGCNGKMGQAIVNAVSTRKDCIIACGVDPYGENNYDFVTYKSFDEINEKFDVIVDFSNPAGLDSLLAYAKSTNTPAVICTTGLSNEQVEDVKSTSKEVAIFYSGNMSLGVNLLIELAKKATKVLGNSFDIEVVEKHHNLKIDAPSGTALMIADGISEELDKEPQYVYDRHSYRKKRAENEIGIHSIRGGTIVGEHDVIFAGNNEVLTISHQAQSKTLFATGAINGGIFLKDKAPGMYNMSDMLAEILN